MSKVEVKMNENEFRFNPFNIEKWDNEQIKEQYSILENQLLFDDLPVAIANDIDVYSSLGYLIGEMISRYFQETNILDATLKVNISNAIYKERETWVKMHDDKAPAMSYFENKVRAMYLEESLELIDKESKLKRWKYAYESVELKQNALKKKLESFKYDGYK